MRKRLTAVLFTAAVAATCLFGACGVTGGDKVSQEEWEAAFVNMYTLENYTVKEHYAYSYDDVHDGDDKYTVTRTGQIDAVTYVAADKVYIAGENKANVSGVPEDKVTDELENYVYTSYYEYYYIQDGETFYRAEYSTSYDSTADKDEETEAPEWTAITVSSLQSVSNPLQYTYRIEQNGTNYKLYELYEQFEYKDGYYTADLYYSGEKCKISLIFKDGYVIKYMNTAQLKSESKKTREATKIVYEFGNFGETEVIPDPKALEAIEKISASA